MKKTSTTKILNRSILKLLHKATLIIFIVIANQFYAAADNNEDCVNCFTTEIIETEIQDNCVSFELEVKAADSCNYALSHFMVSVPYGTITEASNSDGWKMEYPVTDPTTGLSGIKVDDIEEFGEYGSDSFLLTYTVCLNDSSSMSLLTNETIEVAYKAATCVFFEDIKPIVTPLQATLDVTNISCGNSADGSITSTVTGGEPPYDYLWSNGATTPDITNISPGTYTLIVTDDTGHSISLSADVQAPSDIIPQAIVTKANCSDNDGAIDLTVSGGSGFYTYEWSNGSTEEDLVNIASGVYTVIVTDDAGCKRQSSYYVPEDSPVTVISSSNSLKCYETNTGTISLEVDGGTAPYSYEWSTGDTIKDISGLEAGQYSVTVTDAEGCSKSKNTTISKELFYAAVSSTDATCLGDDGSATLTSISGTEPYIINWSNGDTTLTATDLESGYHTVQVTDANGCELLQTVNIKGNEGPQINVNSEWTGCSASDSIRVNASASEGLAPYEWTVNGNISSETFYIHEEDEMVITVIDANGCSTTETIQISAQSAGPEIQLSVTNANCTEPFGSASVAVSGDAPFIIMWNGTEGESHIDSLASGMYEVTVTDSKGCESATSFSIDEINLPQAEIIHPALMPECNSENILLEASTENVQNFNWELQTAGENWIITGETKQTMTYNAGSGSAMAVYYSESADGCIAVDSLLLQCTGDTTPPSDDDSDDNENDNGDDFTTDCGSHCYEISSLVVTSSSSGCYSYEFTISTDGTCRYDLSHLILELEEGSNASNVNNSLNFPVEINSTDPQSGIYGIKIDEISGFGQAGSEQMTVAFDVCNVENPQTEFQFAFKAGQCLDILTHQIQGNINTTAEISEGNVSLIAYPNPVSSEITFEFYVPKDMHVDIFLYDLSGNKFQQIFNGEAKKDIKYKISTNLTNKVEQMFFYRLEAGEEKIDGKILKIQ